MKRFILILLILILNLNIANSITYISEIMYDPDGNDNNREYIEIFSNESINLTNYTIEDLESIDNLVQIYSFNSSFSLIAEEGFNYSGINASIYSVGSTIGNNLNNDGDIILLKNKTNNKIIDLIIYNEDMGGDGNNKALCRFDSNIFENSLIECNSSAGFENIIILNNNTNNTNNQNNSNNSNIINDYSVIKINEFIPNPEGNDNALLPGGEWIELYNLGDSVLSLAGLSLYDNNNNKITISSFNTLETAIIQPHGLLVVYGNGNSILNNNGFEKITLKNNNEAIDEVSYFDSVEGKSYGKFDDLFRITGPTPGLQNVFNEDNSNQSSNIINNININILNSSSIEITKIETEKNDTARFGEIIKVKLNIYKGKTKKSSGKVYVKDISIPTYFNIYKNYQDYTLKLPVILFQNCDNKFKNGTYKLIAESFGVEDSVNITVYRNELCKNYASVSEPIRSNVGNKSVLSESFINYRDEDKKIGLVYKSKDEKVSEYAVYFFIIAAILISGYFLYNERKSKS